MASGSSADTTRPLVLAKLRCQRQVNQPPNPWIQQPQKKTRNRNHRRHNRIFTRDRNRVRHRRFYRKRDQHRQVPEPKTGEGRLSRKVMQCLQTATKTKDREPRSPEQLRTRSSSRSTSRKAPKKQSPLVRRQLTDSAPMPLAREADMATPGEFGQRRHYVGEGYPISSTGSIAQLPSRVETYRSFTASIASGQQPRRRATDVCRRGNEDIPSRRHTTTRGDRDEVG